MTREKVKTKAQRACKSFTVIGTVLLALLYNLAYVADPVIPIIKEWLTPDQYVFFTAVITILLRARTL